VFPVFELSGEEVRGLTLVLTLDLTFGLDQIKSSQEEVESSTS